MTCEHQQTERRNRDRTKRYQLPVKSDTCKIVELYSICLVAVWPVSVSYRHLPVGTFGSVFFVLYDLAGSPFCEILRELFFVNLAGTYFSLKRGAWSIKKRAEASL